MTNYYDTTLLALPSIIRYYRLNEASGTTITDYGSQAQNGTLSGTVTLAQSGMLYQDADTSALFGGGNISLPTTGLPTGNQSFSVGCWVRLSALPANWGHCVQLGNRALHQDITIYYGEDNASVQWSCGTSGGPIIYSSNITSSLIPSIYFLAATYDGTTLTFYVNGISVGTATVTLSLTYGPAQIGTDPNAETFAGKIGKWFLSTAVLSSTQIASLYRAGELGTPAINTPTDGHGIYEDCAPGDAAAFSRLDTIAAGGFKTVLNYDLLNGHIADITAYINHANSKGLKVIISLDDPAIWRDGTIAATYPSLYADSGNLATESGFTTYVVNQVKGLAGTYGYYVADEPASADHTLCHTHYNTITAADSTKPRLIVGSAEQVTGNFWKNTTSYWDSCTVGGDDFYPVGDDTEATYDPATLMFAVQANCHNHGIDSCIVLQAFNWLDWGNQTCSPWPACAVWPTRGQERQQRVTTFANMASRLVLWFSYMDIWGSGSSSRYHIGASSTPAQHWSDLTAALSAQALQIGNHRSFMRIG